MKKEILRMAFKWLVFWLFMIIWLSIGVLWVKAWNGLKANKGDKLTYTKWNELVDKIWQLENKIKSLWGWSIDFSNCYWSSSSKADRPNWAVATCSPGYVAWGWYCYFSKNNKEDSEFEQWLNYFKCRHYKDGSYAIARVYCCKLK